MKTITRFFMPILALALAGCAHQVRTEYDRGAEFDALETFAWRAPENAEVDDPILDSDLLDRRVGKTVTETLAGRGYREVPPEKADFVVTYHTAKDEKLRERSGFSFAFGTGYHHGYHSAIVRTGPGSESYNEGALIIDVLIPEDSGDRLIWRSWREARLSQEAFSEESVRAMVRSILDRFPPGHAPSR